MNKCSNCGAELPEDVKLCETCGTGDIASMLDLAVKYRIGKGLAKDVNRAFVLTYEAIAKGSKYRAFSGLGYFYLYGCFAERDYKKANELFCRGANAGSALGHYQLGKSYFEGRGVGKNLEAAKFLFEKAIEKGSNDAAEEIKKIPDSVRSDSSGISGYTGKPDTSPLPDYVTADYEKAKAGALWNANCRCHTCHDKGTVPCPNCGGKKEFECSTCHGKGHHDSCSDCGSTGKVVCSTCGGSGKVGVDCPVCDHGKVKKTRLENCYMCHGTGETSGGVFCLDCRRKSDAVYSCHYCGSGRVKQLKDTCFICGGTGKKREEYEDICPACHGDYKGYKGEKTCGSCGGTGKQTCSSCNGSGKKTCGNCGGSGKVECSQCHGNGSVKCPECKKREEEEAAAKAKREAAEKKRRAEAAAAEKQRKAKAAAAERERTRASHKSHGTFVTLGFLLGLLGVHFVYIGRWFLFLVQIALTGCGVAQFFVPAINDWVQNLMMPYSMKLNELGVPWLGFAAQYPMLVLAGLFCLWGVLFVIKDGTNHKMERSSDANGVMYILTFILQSWLLFNLADVKWPTTLMWKVLQVIGIMIIPNLHFLFAGIVSRNDKHYAFSLLGVNALLWGIIWGLGEFKIIGDTIMLYVGLGLIVLYLVLTCKAWKTVR